MNCNNSLNLPHSLDIMHRNRVTNCLPIVKRAEIKEASMSSETLKAKERYLEISILNVFLCILVVFIHVSTAPLNTLENGSWQYVAIMIPRRGFAFVVQGFIFLSGLKLFLVKKDNFSYLSYLVRRFVHVFLPYIIWVVLYYLYFVYGRKYFRFDAARLLKHIITGDLVSPFYYIIIIAQFYVLVPLWRRVIVKSNPVILTAFSVIITVISWKYLPGIISAFVPNYFFAYSDRMFTSYLVFWIAGCYAGVHYQQFKKILRDNKSMIRAFFGVALALYLYLCYQRFSLGRDVAFLDDVRVVYCMSAILFFYSASVGLAGAGQKNTASRAIKAINGVDRVSYSIFLTHCLVIFQLDHMLKLYMDLPVRISFPLRLIVVYAVSIGASLLWRKIRDIPALKRQ